MKQTVLKLVLLISMGGAFAGCPPTMEPAYSQLLLRNNSDAKVITLLNVSYPDSSLANAFLEIYIDPRDANYIASTLDLKSYPGLTLFVFDNGYFRRRWHEGVGKPDTYLQEDSILARYVLTKADLDSLDWTLDFP